MRPTLRRLPLAALLLLPIDPIRTRSSARFEGASRVVEGSGEARQPTEVDPTAQVSGAARLAEEGVAPPDAHGRVDVHASSVSWWRFGLTLVAGLTVGESYALRVSVATSALARPGVGQFADADFAARYTISNPSNTADLRFVLVPEPTTAGPVTVGGLALGLLGRARRVRVN